jgi:hypothetical protein
LPHADIAVQPNNQRVAESASLIEAADMSWMQQIKAPIREHNAAPVAFLSAKPQNRFLKCQNLWVQRNSMKAHAKIAPALDEKLVYHAPRGLRLGAGRLA